MRKKHVELANEGWLDQSHQHQSTTRLYSHSTELFDPKDFERGQNKKKIKTTKIITLIKRKLNKNNNKRPKNKEKIKRIRKEK